jgi:hypothetical protein
MTITVPPGAELVLQQTFHVPAPEEGSQRPALMVTWGFACRNDNASDAGVIGYLTLDSTQDPWDASPVVFRAGHATKAGDWNAGPARGLSPGTHTLRIYLHTTTPSVFYLHSQVRGRLNYTLDEGA